MTVTLKYFAWVRERVGHGEEQAELPPHVKTVSETIAWLKTRGEGYQHAFERQHIIRAAVDHVHAPHNAEIAGAREIAFFPPVTGG
jgi:molybdopterin synthase sulfur carrier subunit